MFISVGMNESREGFCCCQLHAPRPVDSSRNLSLDFPQLSSNLSQERRTFMRKVLVTGAGELIGHHLDALVLAY